MPHVMEPATSARATCRGCNQKIAKGELRFGERQPNAFGEGEMTLWFHLACAAYKRPEAFLEVARESTDPAVVALIPTADAGIAHRRLPRVNGAERAPTGRARCRSCRELIDTGTWRISLTFFEEYRFAPSTSKRRRFSTASRTSARISRAASSTSSRARSARRAPPERRTLASARRRRYSALGAALPPWPMNRLWPPGSVISRPLARNERSFA